MSDAIAALSAELAADPASLAFLPLGEALRQRGQLDAALAIAQRGLERHPHLADAHDLLARVQADRGALEEAADEWDMVARLSPGHPGALKGLGFVRFRQGRLAEAEQYLTAAAAVDPTDDRNLSALAYVRAQRVASGEAPAARATPLESLGATPPGQAAAGDAARELFADLTEDGAGLALLIGGDGLVLAGETVTHEGRDVSAEIGAAMSGVGDEAQRAMRHLGLGPWTGILVETTRATVAMAPAPDHGLVLVAVARSAPLGFVRRLLARASGAAARFLGEGA